MKAGWIDIRREGGASPAFGFSTPHRFSVGACAAVIESGKREGDECGKNATLLTDTSRLPLCSRHASVKGGKLRVNLERRR